MKKIRVAELFAGVGGFRLGLEKGSGDFEVVWSNQWEPLTRMQHASLVYEARFGKENHSNEDIAKVQTKDIPEHDLLVGGFPCQDLFCRDYTYKFKRISWKERNSLVVHS
jgi:DNA (cytosine-5)-methyltransferase 1